MHGEALVINQSNGSIISNELFSDIEKIIHGYFSKIESIHNEMSVDEIIPAILVLAESYEYIMDKSKWNNIILQLLTIVRDIINGERLRNGLALFGGLCELGLAVYILNKNTGYYKNLLTGINDIITSSISEVIDSYIQDISNLKMQHYDSITGVSGIVCYLIHTEDPSNAVLVKLLSYLVEITKKRNVEGHMVLGWHIKSENQFRSHEKIRYPKGNFNFGLSHGIAGPLAALSLAYQKGVCIDGHQQAISDIMEEYKKLAAYESGCVYWPGQYSYENYVLNSKEFLQNDNRMSWCYGSIGILRALQLGAKAIDDNALLDWIRQNTSSIAQLDISAYNFLAPTLCHGYAGLLSLLTIEYRENKNPSLEKRINDLAKLIVSSYDENAKFGFINIDEDIINGSLQILKTEDNSFLNGSAGIMLTLISLIKQNTRWEIHLLAK